MNRHCLYRRVQAQAQALESYMTLCALYVIQRMCEQSETIDTSNLQYYLN